MFILLLMKGFVLTFYHSVWMKNYLYTGESLSHIISMFSEAVIHSCSIKIFLKINRKTTAIASVLLKVRIYASNLHVKERRRWCFSIYFSKFFKTTSVIASIFYSNNHFVGTMVIIWSYQFIISKKSTIAEDTLLIIF